MSDDFCACDDCTGKTMTRELLSALRKMDWCFGDPETVGQMPTEMDAEARRAAKAAIRAAKERGFE